MACVRTIGKTMLRRGASLRRTAWVRTRVWRTCMLVIDAHQHLWDLETGSYPWLTPDLGPINRTFAFGELEPQLQHHGVDRTVLVQAANSFEDTEAMLAVARRWPRVAGVVGWLPLLDPADAVAAIERYADDELVVGVRHLIHDEPDPDWVVQGGVLTSLGLLAEAGLTFDVVGVLPQHLEHVVTIARRHPGLRLVIDHLNKPPIASGEMQPWRALLAAAAECPNVFAKVSGLNTAADWATWSATDLQPYVDAALELFGPERLMFGGDWPVSLLAGDYGRVVEATRTNLAGLSPSEQELVWGRTAASFYQLAL